MIPLTNKMSWTLRRTPILFGSRRMKIMHSSIARATQGVPSQSQLHSQTPPNLSPLLVKQGRVSPFAEKQKGWNRIARCGCVYAISPTHLKLPPLLRSLHFLSTKLSSSAASPSCLQCIFVRNSHWTKANSQPRIQQACCHCYAEPLETKPAQGFPNFASHLWFSFTVASPLLPVFIENWLSFLLDCFPLYLIVFLIESPLWNFFPKIQIFQNLYML